ncbi:hypothetical protein BT69DRAFT_820376 [Atractiella rhizophila]|nr:hypothetical protein BT69DRAFT_820376 [Atractiella rhizophila]
MSFADPFRSPSDRLRHTQQVLNRRRRTSRSQAPTLATPNHPIVPPTSTQRSKTESLPLRSPPYPPTLLRYSASRGFVRRGRRDTVTNEGTGHHGSQLNCGINGPIRGRPFWMLLAASLSSLHGLTNPESWQ